MATRTTVAIFGDSSTVAGSPNWVAAERCGGLLAAAGLVVATGGYGGVMEAAAEGAAAASGHVVGITAPLVFPDRAGPNPYISTEHRAQSLTDRIRHMVDIADGAIALPGSIGTFTELLVAWNVAFVARYNRSVPAPIVAVGATWRELVAMVTSRLDTDGSLVTCVETVDEAAALVIERLGFGRAR